MRPNSSSMQFFEGILRVTLKMNSHQNILTLVEFLTSTVSISKFIVLITLSNFTSNISMKVKIWGQGIRSIGWRGVKPWTVSNGLFPIDLLTELL